MVRKNRFLRDQSLTIVTVSLFLILLAAQAVTGHRVHNEELMEHGESELNFLSYLGSGHFIEATFENWESEYLQMGFYVLLTAYLFQRGSAESRDPDEPQPRPKKRSDPNAPWAVRRGGIWLVIYEYSLTIALFALFVFSFLMHVWGGAREFSEEEVAHGGNPVSTWAFMKTSRCWFESFQNWQSEFLAVASLVVLSIFLRQRGSPESKNVEDPHGKTGA